MPQVTVADFQPFVAWLQTPSGIVSHTLRAMLWGTIAQETTESWLGDLAYAPGGPAPLIIGALADQQFFGPDIVQLLIQLSQPVRIFLIYTLWPFARQPVRPQNKFFFTTDQINKTINLPGEEGSLQLEFNDDSIGENYSLYFVQSAILNRPRLARRAKEERK
jgi:hypothetical protein